MDLQGLLQIVYRSRHEHIPHVVSLCENYIRILMHGVGLEGSSVICAVGYPLGLVCEAVANTRGRVVHKHVLIAVQSDIHFERTCRRRNC